MARSISPRKELMGWSSNTHPYITYVVAQYWDILITESCWKPTDYPMHIHNKGKVRKPRVTFQLLVHVPDSRFRYRSENILVHVPVHLLPMHGGKLLWICLSWSFSGLVVSTSSWERSWNHLNLKANAKANVNSSVNLERELTWTRNFMRILVRITVRKSAC